MRAKMKRNKIYPSGLQISKKELEALKFRNVIRPEDFVKQIRLPQLSNIEAQIDLSLTPYLRKPISLISDYRVETIIIIAPTQSGKTVVLQVAVAWSIDQDPGPLLYIYPDEETAKKAMEEKIIGMIRETPCLSKRVKGIRKISQEGIRLDSMTIYPGWSNSLASLSAFPKKRVVWDEVRLFKLTVGQESNALKLGNDRMTTYLNLGLGQGIMASSPSTEGDLLHQQLDISGTQIMLWNVPCPVCGRFQILDFFTNIKEPKDGGPIVCRCRFEGCGGVFDDRDGKRKWNNKGVYAPKDTPIEKDGSFKGRFKNSKRMIFWYDSMVSPFRSFDRIWTEFIETKDKLHDYRNFVQTWLAQFWKQGFSRSNIESIKLHKIGYKLGQVPAGVKVLVLGIDTQDDALFYTVWGFGFDNECWLVDEGNLQCQISTTNEDDLFALVQGNLVNAIYLGEDDREWKIAIGAWDSGGHRTKEVYSVCRKVRQILPIKGRNNQARRVMFSKADTHYNIRTEEYLDETENVAVTNKFHLPEDVSLEFMAQFVNKAKLKDQNRKTGHVIWRWTTKGADHLRMASAYAFSCLDIPISAIGTIRSSLRKKDFEMNPKRGQARQQEPQEPKEGERQKSENDPFEKHEQMGRGKRKYGGWW